MPYIELDVLNNAQKPILGIDLGTTNSLAAMWRDGRPVVLRPDEAHSADARIPSVIHFPKEGNPVVGRAAREYAPLRLPALSVSHVFHILPTRSLRVAIALPYSFGTLTLQTRYLANARTSHPCGSARGRLGKPGVRLCHLEVLFRQGTSCQVTSRLACARLETMDSRQYAFALAPEHAHW